MQRLANSHRVQNVVAVNVNLFGGIRSDHDYYFGVEFNLNSLMAAYRLATDNLNGDSPD